MIGRVNTGGGTGAALTVTAPAATNLITFPSDYIPNGVTKSGITFTATDGYYEFNGTATQDLWLCVHYLGADAPFDLNAEYSLSGAPESSSLDTFRMAATNGLGAWKYDDGAGVTFQFSEIKEGPARVEIQIFKGATLDHVVFRPQLVKRNATVVTVSKDGKTKTKTAGADGLAVFKGLETGTWTVTITDGEQTAQKTVTVTADYSTSITFFSATIHVTYPAGSTCTATDGVTILTAPDTSGTWDIIVEDSGAWTIELNGCLYADVSVTTSGETYSVDLTKFYLYNQGNEYTSTTGGWVADRESTGGTFTKNSDNITIQGTGKNGVAAVNENGIRITGFTTVKLRLLSASSSGAASFVFANSRGYSFSGIASTSISGTTAEKILSLDISSITESSDNYFIKVCSTNGRTVKFDQVWLEV